MKLLAFWSKLSIKIACCQIRTCTCTSKIGRGHNLDVSRYCDKQGQTKVCQEILISKLIWCPITQYDPHIFSYSKFRCGYLGN